ncbi:hypothetical protein [Soonwooa purpurea]
MIEKLISQAKHKEDQWYSNKAVFALPDWFTLTSEPELIALLPVHGTIGLDIIKQRVDFQVDFDDKNSIQQYARFLESQMNKELSIEGYVLFYNKNVLGKKDPDFKFDLSPSQELEIKQYNVQRNKLDITVAYFDSDSNLVESLVK